MPGTTVLDIAPQDQAQMLAALRRARWLSSSGVAVEKLTLGRCTIFRGFLRFW
jgi:hypothetical protein